MAKNQDSDSEKAAGHKDKKYAPTVVWFDFKDLSIMFQVKRSSLVSIDQALMSIEVGVALLVRRERCSKSVVHDLRDFLSSRKLPLPRYGVIGFHVTSPSSEVIPLETTRRIADGAQACSAVLKEFLLIPEETVTEYEVPEGGITVGGSLTSSRVMSEQLDESLSLDGLRGQMKEAVRRSGLSLEEIGVRMGLNPGKNAKSKMWWLLHKTEDPGIFTLETFCQAVELPLTQLLSQVLDRSSGNP